MIASVTALGAKFLDGADDLAQAPPTTAVSGAQPSFEQTLAKTVSDAVGAVQDGEAAAIQGVDGAMPTFKVVEQLMSAQRSLQQIIAIRDKAVSAYQDIAHMTI